MWRSCSEVLSSVPARQRCPSWQGPGEVLEGPGRLPSLREPNWNTPLCLFLCVSLNPFLFFWLSRIFENKNTRARLPVSFFYSFSFTCTHLISNTQSLTDVVCPTFFFLSRFLSFAVQNLHSFPALLFRGSCAVVSSSSPPTQPHFSLNLSFSSPYPFVIFIVWEEEEEEEEELFSVRCLWKQWRTGWRTAALSWTRVKLPLLLLNASSVV